MINNTEGPAHDPPVPDRYRHISVEERDGVLLVKFVDLRKMLEGTGSLQEAGQEFRMMASNRQKCLVVLDLEGQEVSVSELFICYLVRLEREVKQVQGTLKLCNLSPAFDEALRMIRLDRMFPIYQSLDDALLDRSEPS